MSLGAKSRGRRRPQAAAGGHSPPMAFPPGALPISGLNAFHHPGARTKKKGQGGGGAGRAVGSQAGRTASSRLCACGPPCKSERGCECPWGRNQGGGVGRRPTPEDIRPQGHSHPAPCRSADETLFPQSGEEPKIEARAGVGRAGRKHLDAIEAAPARALPPRIALRQRSEERRVGKEWGSTWRARWSPCP